MLKLEDALREEILRHKRNTVREFSLRSMNKDMLMEYLERLNTGM